MDAALEAGKNECHIEFNLTEIQAHELPGIESYRRALECAKRTHAENLDAAEATIERIEQCIEQDRIPVLNVLDNGIGLDKRRMESLLGDGSTDKTGVSAERGGSFGVGHFTAFPASDPRYILYGGVTKTGQRCMSGHAILASHKPEKSPPPSAVNTSSSYFKLTRLGKDGYFVAPIANDDSDANLAFCHDSNVPVYTDRLLDRISSAFGSGSVVSVIGFNNFRRDHKASAAKLILEAVASNFFIPLLDGRLNVCIDENGKKTELTNAKLWEIVISSRTVRRMTKQSVLRGESVFDAVTTWMNNDSQSRILQTSFGEVQCAFRMGAANESTKLLLFRNGMYISDDIPKNRARDFAVYKPFNCVLNVNPADTEGSSSDEREVSAFQIIRKAEGEKHLDLDASRLKKDFRPQFESFLREIHEEILEFCTENDLESFSPSIFEFENTGAPPTALRNKKETSRRGTQGSLDVIDEEPQSYANGSEGNKPSKRKKKKEFVTRRPAVPFDAIARREGSRVLLQIRAQKPIRNGILQLQVHGGSDVSCDLPIRDQYAKFRILGPYDHTSNSTQSYVLGAISEGDQKELEIEISQPRMLASQAVLKILVTDESRGKERIAS